MEIYLGINTTLVAVDKRISVFLLLIAWAKPIASLWWVVTVNWSLTLGITEKIILRTVVSKLLWGKRRIRYGKYHESMNRFQFWCENFISKSIIMRENLSYNIYMSKYFVSWNIYGENISFLITPISKKA